MIDGGDMKKIIAIFISGLFLFITSRTLMAGGTLKRLQTIGENMTLQQKVLDQEAKNYKKAEELINSPDIKKDLSTHFILERCGEPIAKANDGMRWVYKPPSSTFFKGEKIYFIFDKNNKVISWEKIYQQ